LELLSDAKDHMEVPEDSSTELRAPHSGHGEPGGVPRRSYRQWAHRPLRRRRVLLHVEMAERVSQPAEAYRALSANRPRQIGMSGIGQGQGPEVFQSAGHGQQP
jgi:hypothetical protein